VRGERPCYKRVLERREEERQEEEKRAGEESRRRGQGGRDTYRGGSPVCSVCVCVCEAFQGVGGQEKSVAQTGEKE